MVLPKDNSRELLSDKVLYVMHLIMHGYEVDLPELVMEHMLYSSTQARNHILPYANLLPLFFEHFGIPMDDEEKISSGFRSIDENTLQRLGIVQTINGEWKFLSDISGDEVKNKKFAKTKALTLTKVSADTPITLAHVLEKHDLIVNDVDELKQS